MSYELLFSLIFSFLSIASQKIFSCTTTLVILSIYTIPLGWLFIDVFNLFRQYNLSFLNKIILSLSTGLSLLVMFSYLSLYISFNIYIIIVLEFLFIFLLLIIKLKKKIKNEQKKIIIEEMPFSKWLFILAIGLFVYYSLVPLTTDYAEFRDYPLLTLGVEENSDLLLPSYDIAIYYPPGISLITAVIHQFKYTTSPNTIMIHLSYFFVFLIIVLFYLIGKILFEKEIMGFLFSVMFLIGAVSRNFLTGGSTIPANLATIFGLLFILFLCEYLKKDVLERHWKYVFFAAIFLGVMLLAHFDTLLTFLWGFISLGIILCITQKDNVKHHVNLFVIISVISFLIAAPFLLRSYDYKKTLDNYWDDETWDTYAHDEIHPKPLFEIIFIIGPLFFFLGMFGFIIGFLNFYKLFRKNKTGILQLFLAALVCWVLLIFLSNSFWFLRLVKPIFLFYAINIILWHGITIPLTFLGGIGLFFVYTSVKYKHILIILFMLGSLFSIIDYETINIQNVFIRQGGFILNSFADRAGYMNQGDIKVFHYMQALPKGIVLSAGSVAGEEQMAFTYLQGYTHVTNPFYQDLEMHQWMSLRKEQRDLFLKTNDNEFIIQKNISYLLIPAEITISNLTSGDINASHLYSQYSLLYRCNGAKIFSTNLTGYQILHYEIENNLEIPREIISYNYGTYISLVTVALRENDSIVVNIPFTLQNNSVRIYVKHLTFVEPLSFDIIINGTTYLIEKTSSKLTFSESSIVIPEGALGHNIILKGTSKGIDFFGLKQYYPEIDWIEITPFSQNTTSCE